MELIIHIEHKPLFVREPGKVWHCLHSPGGHLTRCHVSFDPTYHPDKVVEWHDGEGFIPPPEERCGRNGCKHQYEVLDTLAALIATKRAEIGPMLMGGCRATKAFTNVEDAADVLTMTCDWGYGHGGKVHHDPVKNAEWFA